MRCKGKADGPSAIDRGGTPSEGAGVGVPLTYRLAANAAGYLCVGWERELEQDIFQSVAAWHRRIRSVHEQRRALRRLTAPLDLK